MGVFEFNARYYRCCESIIANLKDATTIIGGGDCSSSYLTRFEDDLIFHWWRRVIRIFEGKELPGN